MNNFRIGFFLILLLLRQSIPAIAADYFVSIEGNDANPGNAALPWRTINRAAEMMRPGDAVTVRAGVYDERITTVRGGESEESRIMFRAEGTVTMRGFSVRNAYITVDGFDITGHSDSDRLSAYVQVTRDGSYFHLLNSTIRDGIKIVREDMLVQNNTVLSRNGGFLGAGFKPGQTIWIGRGERTRDPANSGTAVIAMLTDDSMSVDVELADEGPSHMYLTGSYVYGLVIRAGARNCVIAGNRFTNLSYDAWFVGGEFNLFENNILEQGNGWDAMHFMGTDHVFRRNWIRNSPLEVYQISPDVFENWAAIPYERILFIENWVQNFAGVLAAQKGSAGDSGPLTFMSNVFIDVGRFNIAYPNTSFINNVFINVAAQDTPVTSVSQHPIRFAATHTYGAVVENNIFVGSGQGGNPQEEGWYEFSGSALTARVGHNFVAGPAPEFAAKSGFSEGIPELNGGDPGFVNLLNPLGPDGIPFTEDDGLRLRPNSKLRGAGVGGVDLGAYQQATTAGPELSVTLLDSQARISWPVAAEGYVLQSSLTPAGSWGGNEVPVVIEGSEKVIKREITGQMEFFRLVRVGEQ